MYSSHLPADFQNIDDSPYGGEYKVEVVDIANDLLVEVFDTEEEAKSFVKNQEFPKLYKIETVN